MAIDVSSNLRALGINATVGTNQLSQNRVSNAGVKVAPAPKGVRAVASSAAKFAGGAINGALRGVGKSFTNTASGITQGLPGIGSIARNQKAADAARTTIDQAHKAYAKQYSEGKINKTRYHALLKDLSKDYDSLANQDKQNAKTVKPVDFATGLATVATAPLAAGRLIQGAGKINGLANQLPKIMAPAEKSRGIVAAAALAPAKSALMYAPTAKATAEIPGQVQSGDYKGAAMNAGLLASPLAIAGAAKVLPKLGNAVSEATYGKSAGPIKSFFGGKAVDAAVKNNPRLQKVLKQAELFTQDQPGVKAGKHADEFFKTYLEDTLGLDPKKLSVEEFASRFQQYAKPVEKLNALKAAGKADQKLVLTANYGSSTRKAIEKAGVDFDNTPMIDRGKLAKEIANKVAGENPTARDSIGKILTQSETLDDALKQIAQLDRLPGTKIPGFTAPKGFRLSPAGPKNQAKLANLSEVSGDLEKGKSAAPIFKTVGNILKKSGLSTESQDPAVYAKYKTYLGDELKKSGLDVKDVTEKLNKYSMGLQGFGVSDERQLGTYALKQALGTSDSKQADAVRKAIFKAYDRMTFGDLSLAGKIENALYKIPGYGGYRRIQGIGRYQGNPFFRLQSSVEAEILSQNLAKGKTPTIPGLNNIHQKMFSASADELDDITKKLKKRFGEGFSGEGAADTSYGIITAKLTRTQEKSVSGLVKTLAERNKQTVDEFLEGIDPQTLDNIRSVVQYPRQGFTSSNFAKTMNMLVFPSRYNTKLAGIAGRAIADMPPLMQIGTLKGLSDFSNFLETDEGIKWKSDNSEVIGVLSYLNPVGNIGKIMQGVKTGNLSISDLGIIGGLPLGVITQIVKSQTGASTAPPYIDPKTGELVPDKLPANMAGSIKLFIIDVINSMYSFPGRTFGMNISKKDITQSLPGLKLSGDNVKDSERQPTAKQQRIQWVLAEKNSATTSKKVMPPPKRFVTEYGQTPLKPLPVLSLPAPPSKAAKGKRVKPKAFRPRPL